MESHKNTRDPRTDPRSRTSGGAPGHRQAALGMLMGIVAGAGAATLLFVITGNALWFVLIGISTAVGLLAGASVEKRREATVSD